jgi:hypothetical protein
VALPLLFVALSLDEVTEIHEFSGRMSDGLLPGGRTATPFAHTGIWMFLLGIPFIAGLIWLVGRMRPYFTQAPDALRTLVLGMGVMLAGAIGVETLSNLTVGTPLAPLQIAAEEFLELIGATLVIWGGYTLLERHAFAIVMAPAIVGAEAPSRVRSAAHEAG